MTSKKKIHRARRHTFALLDEAAEALASGHDALARKVVQRALEAGFMNPRVYFEAAALVRDLDGEPAAVETLRRALAIAPGYAPALALLREWGVAPDAEPTPAVAPAPVAPTDAMPARTRTAHVAFDVRVLREVGILAVPAFLAPAEAEALAAPSDDDAAFVHAHALATPVGAAARAVWREPLPEPLAGFAAEAYAFAAEAANAMRAAIGLSGRFPAAEPPPRTPVDRAQRILLADGAGLDKRRDHGSRDTFPFRVLVGLTPAALSVAQTDVRPGKPRVRRVEVGRGALVLHCARERPVGIAGVLGLQAIEWELIGPTTGAAQVLALAWPHVAAG